MERVDGTEDEDDQRDGDAELPLGEDADEELKEVDGTAFGLR